MKMNKNQKAVLYELESENEVTSPFLCVKKVVLGDLRSYNELTEKEEFEVLAEFAKWRLEND